MNNVLGSELCGVVGAFQVSEVADKVWIDVVEKLIDNHQIIVNEITCRRLVVVGKNILQLSRHVVTQSGGNPKQLARITHCAGQQS
jgi:hypothetical protein